MKREQCNAAAPEHWISVLSFQVAAPNRCFPADRYAILMEQARTRHFFHWKHQTNQPNLSAQKSRLQCTVSIESRLSEVFLTLPLIIYSRAKLPCMPSSLAGFYFQIWMKHSSSVLKLAEWAFSRWFCFTRIGFKFHQIFWTKYYGDTWRPIFEPILLSHFYWLCSSLHRAIFYVVCFPFLSDWAMLKASQGPGYAFQPKEQPGFNLTVLLNFCTLYHSSWT
jgi:hypothetical protein